IDFQKDPFYPYTAWIYYPSAYGPGWELLAAGAARLSGDGVMANVLTFKLVSVLAYAGSAILIALTLKRRAPERALLGTALFAWNPVVLYETAGNAHNDAVMVLFIALAFFLLAWDRFTLSAAALTIGATVKFIPALLVPLVVVAGLSAARGWKSRAVFLAVTAAVCAGVVAAAYAPFWHGGDILGVARRSELFTTSLPTLVDLTLASSLGAQLADSLTIRFAMLLLGAWIVRQMRKLWQRGPSFDSVAEASTSVLLFFLLVSCLWLEAWYSVWPIALAALLPEGSLVTGAVFFSYVTTFKMPLFEYVLVPGPTLPPQAWREWRLTLGTLGAPWLYAGHQFAKKGIKRYGSRIGGRRQAAGGGTNQDAADSALVG
ncbi:MAG: glycosyltransferase 87 family protein, partial [Chloroflexi bacterium]|nr:glycosyltransferase 87 family protein [Chloroflexota bacterium]